MLSATANTTAWAGVGSLPRSVQIKVWPYRVARSRGAFLGSEILLASLALIVSAHGEYSPGALVLIACCGLIFHINNVDKTLVSARNSQFWIDFLESISLGFLASATIFYLVPFLVPSFNSALATVVMTALMPVSLRLFLRFMVMQGRCVDEVLIVGGGELPAKLHQALDTEACASKRNTRMLTISDSLDRGGIDLTELKELVAREEISRVVIAERDPDVRERLASSLLELKLRGLRVDDAVDFFEECRGKIWLEAIDPQWFVYSKGFDHSAATAFAERCLDLAFASTMLILSAPVLLAVAIAIKLDSKGPVLFRQERVGLNGVPFVMYKFRSMRQDAERGSGPAWASEWDHRVTKIGRFLRAFRLDELPQAINVLRGDMSMVGPRPERPCFVVQLEQEIPYYNLRHFLKPGITGWAQVMYEYAASVEDTYEKLQYDFYYAKHKSLGTDLTIMLKTVRIVLFGRGR